MYKLEKITDSQVTINLKELMELNNVSYTKLTELTGLTPRTINGIRNKDISRRLSIQTIVKLAKVFNVSLDELINY